MNKKRNKKKVRQTIKTSTRQQNLPVVAIHLDPNSPGTCGMLRGIRLFERKHTAWLFMLMHWNNEKQIISFLNNNTVNGYLGGITPVVADVLSARNIKFVSTLSASAVSDNLKVYSDPVLSAQLIASHFIDRGITDLALLSSSIPSPAIKKRESAFKQEAILHKHTYTECRINLSIKSNIETQIEKVSKWLIKQPTPLGIMAIHDKYGWCALTACQRLGIKVPEEVAIVGTQNNENICEFCNPPLSSLAQDQQRIGFEAARILDDLLNNKPIPPKPTLIPPIGLVARESSDLLKVHDPLVAKALDFIRMHVGDGIHACDVMAHIPASARTIQRRFRAVLGRTITAEIHRVRIEKVRKELLSSDLCLAEVADLAGYNYLSQMCRDFRAATNMTPTDYRRLHGV